MDHIIVGIDGSTGSARALDWAAEQASRSGIASSFQDSPPRTRRAERIVPTRRAEGPKGVQASPGAHAGHGRRSRTPSHPAGTGGSEVRKSRQHPGAR
ncbi:MAG: universal stress protein [Microlunatus sp.]|nr:universal stress protein [Microlunatus sp.]